MLNLFEATEHTMHKNQTQSLHKSKQLEFGMGDKVLFCHPSSKLSHFTKAHHFKPMNEVGVISDEALPGSIYKMQLECEEQVVVK